MSKTAMIVIGYLVAGFLTHMFTVHRATAGKPHFNGFMTAKLPAWATTAEDVLLWPISLGYDLFGKS